MTNAQQGTGRGGPTDDDIAAYADNDPDLDRNLRREITLRSLVDEELRAQIALYRIMLAAEKTGDPRQIEDALGRILGAEENGASG